MFNPKDRLIYKFFDGTRARRIDPMKVQQKIAKSGVEIYDEWKKLSPEPGQPDKVNEQAMNAALERIVGVGRSAFGVPEFSEDDQGISIGLTDGELLLLLTDFFTWMGNLEKKVDPTPTLPPPTAPKSSVGVESPIINSSSDSTLTDTAV